MNDIQFHPVHPSVDPVMFRKLDRRVATLYVMLVDVLLPLCVYGYFSSGVFEEGLVITGKKTSMNSEI